MDDFYSLETNDIKIVQGDTLNLEFEFVDSNDLPIDITNYFCHFTLKHPVTGEIIQMLPVISSFSKEHDDDVDGGSGIYFYGDTQIIGTGVSLTANNQIIIILDPNDTNELEYGMVYQFDIQFSKYGNKVTATPIRGNLIISKEVTP